MFCIHFLISSSQPPYEYYFHFQPRFWEVSVPTVTQLGSGRTWTWTQPVWLQTLITPSSTFSPDVPDLGAQVSGRSKVLWVMFSRLIPAAQDAQEIRRGLVLPSCLTATCSLMTITRMNCYQWQCGRSSSNLDLHLRLVRSKVPFNLTELIPTFLKTSIWIMQKSEGFFQTWKALQGPMYHNLHLSRDSSLLSEFRQGRFK